MTNVSQPVPEQAPQTPAVQNEMSPAEKFQSMVARELQSVNKGVEMTSSQKRLATNFFVKLDMALKDAEVKRLATKEEYRAALSFEWKNVNLQRLAMDVVAFSSVGLDPLQPNHLNLIPFKNNATNKYDIAFIMGYRGIELKAKKYGLDVPVAVSVELIFKNDTFKAIKKDINNEYDSYILEVNDAFNRGEIIGGFYYMEHENEKMNRIRLFTKADIDKRIPKHASPEFWGGEKEVWEKDAQGKSQKVKKEVEGWYEEMAYKTIYRAAYNSITIDSTKIDENYMRMLAVDNDMKDEKVRAEIEANANLGNTLSIAEEPPVVDSAPISVDSAPLGSAVSDPVPTPVDNEPATLFNDGQAPY